jgi:hypothetical protein
MPLMIIISDGGPGLSMESLTIMIYFLRWMVHCTLQRLLRSRPVVVIAILLQISKYFDLISLAVHRFAFRIHFFKIRKTLNGHRFIRILAVFVRLLWTPNTIFE